MSSVSDNQMGPVLEPNEKILAIANNHAIRSAALASLHQKHRESKIHHFHDAHMDDHVKNWKLLKWAEGIILSLIYDIFIFLRTCSVWIKFFLQNPYWW